MDTVTRARAERIADDWRLSDDERAKLIDQPEALAQMVKIHDSLHRIFSENDFQANDWIAKPNAAFEGRPALSVMLDGDIERVRKYLVYYLYNN